MECSDYNKYSVLCQKCDYPIDLGCSKDKMSESNTVINNGYGVYFCPSCKGSVWQIKEESKYCFRCGEKLNWD